MAPRHAGRCCHRPALTGAEARHTGGCCHPLALSGALASRRSAAALTKSSRKLWVSPRGFSASGQSFLGPCFLRLGRGGLFIHPPFPVPVQQQHPAHRPGMTLQALGLSDRARSPETPGPNGFLHVSAFELDPDLVADLRDVERAWRRRPVRPPPFGACLPPSRVALRRTSRRAPSG
jgi:hypothetical protein